ncbi:AHH domain-containing protein (plasmid) [Aliiroseovarius crassostreae]|uniref:AHH domain-containing protein n=1 Tax=Aliiroseovarius crassostreae TaxID=154981 RepID=A0A9Q9HHR7_9RHOB|nr:AHH domain-containing protein [Aliiroseovarius crassostreae]UWP97180.1 AHH domain-containing protein [Aliiroseovarius crassostreae]
MKFDKKLLLRSETKLRAEMYSLGGRNVSGVARRIGDNALDAVDVAMSALDGNWFEFFFEMVPYAGDAYSLGKLAKVSPEIYRQVTRIQNRMDLAYDAIQKRSKLRSAMRTPRGKQAHHLMPVDVLDSPVVQAALEAGFDFNGVENGMNVDAQAGSHGRRTGRLAGRLADFARDNPSYSPQEALSFVRSERTSIRRAGNVVTNE